MQPAANPFAKPQFPNASGTPQSPQGPNILNPLQSTSPPPTHVGPPPTTQYYSAPPQSSPPLAQPYPVNPPGPLSQQASYGPPPSQFSTTPPHGSTTQYQGTVPYGMGPGQCAPTPPVQGAPYSNAVPSGYPQQGQQPPYPQQGQQPPYPQQGLAYTQQVPTPAYPQQVQPPPSTPQGPYTPPAPASQPQQQAQQGPRIDPSQIPSPSVLADGRPVKFRTQIGQVPGPAAGQYVAIDEANATPRFVRMTMYTIPCTEDVHQTSHIPFAVVVQPLAEVGLGEAPVPLVDFSAVGGPIRCRRCRAYINPYNVFVDGGRRFVCKFCSCENEVPDGYFSPLEGSGKRHDIGSRPELTRGSVDFVASSEYIQKPLGPLRYVFVIDVSEHSVTSGMLQVLLDTLRRFLTGLGDSNSKVAIITFDNTVHFWNLRSTLQQPQMMVVPDVTNIFVPLGGDGLFFTYRESKSVFDTLLEKLASMFTTGARSSPEAFSAAVQAGSLALEGIGGRVVAFTSGTPDSEMKRREDAKLLGTEKERTLYAPRSATLKALATECAGRATAIDLFVCSPAGTCDLVSLAVLPTTTGGNLFSYPGFTSERDGERLGAETLRTLTKSFGYDAIAKVRCSQGITVSDHLGNLRVSSSHDIEFAGIDCDKSIVVALKHDDKLEEKSEPVIQFAMLYTTSNGDRRIRVHNITVNCSMTLPNLFRGADLDAILNVYARVAIRAISTSTLSEVRNLIAEKCVDVLAAYRKYCASSTSPGQLILPESLKILPVFVLALSKSLMLRPGSDITADDRALFMALFNSEGPSITTPLIYPRLYALHKIGPEFGVPDEEGRLILPTPLRLSAEHLDADGAYLLENGIDVYLWFGRNAPANLVSELQGALQHDQPVGELGSRAHAILGAIRSQRCKGAVVRVVRSRDTLETKLFSMLVEDRSASGEQNSYVDFLCTVHKHIQNKLS